MDYMSRTKAEDEGGTFLGALFSFILLIAAFTAGPFILIWAMEQLTSMQIETTWTTWFASLLIIGLLRS